MKMHTYICDKGGKNSIGRTVFLGEYQAVNAEINFYLQFCGFTFYFVGPSDDKDFFVYINLFLFHFSFGLGGLISRNWRSKRYKIEREKAEFLSEKYNKKIYQYQISIFSRRETGIRIGWLFLLIYVWKGSDWNNDDKKKLPWNGNGWEFFIGKYLTY